MPDDEPTPHEDDPGDDQPDKDWHAEADKWKRLSRENEAKAKANAAAAKRLAEIEESQKSDQQKLADAQKAFEDRALKAEREAARLRVGMKKGLTEAQVRRLVGDTDEELEADADELLATFAPPEGEADTDLPRRPRERLRPGARPEAEPEPSVKEIVASIPRGGF